ncbi:terpene synthase family protein [Streptomyces violascens]|uniref:terpene synthase family protein n=1 Tax=Streptomyces violascens TaxID=67381 RepID=UPI00367D799E
MNLTEILGGLPTEAISIWPVVPLRRHPEADAIDEAVVDWLVGHGLCEPGSTQARSHVAATLANALSFGRAKAVAAYAYYGTWAFLWDDHLDALAADPLELGHHIAEANWALTAPFTAYLPDNKWLVSLRDSRRFWEDSWDPAAVERMTAANADWFMGQLSKAMLMRRPTAPTVSEVLRMRLQKAGMWSAATATANAGGYRLSAAEHADPRVRAFMYAAYGPAAVLNEFLGVAKELVTPETGRTNLVSAIACEHALDLAAAITTAWELYERIGCLALALQAQLLHDVRPNVARLAAELPQWIPATVDIMTTSVRYQEIPGHGVLDVPTVTLTDTPVFWDPQDLTPPPYPDIAWWWDQLA